MAVAEISVIPIGTKTASIGNYVSSVVALLSQRAKQYGLKYELTAMCTQIEGSPHDIFAVAQEIHEYLFRSYPDLCRVVTALKIDDRRDKELTLKGKVESVLARLG